MSSTYLAMLLILLGYPASVRAQVPEWERMRVDPTATHFQAVAISPEIPTRAFAATQHVLYESTDNGQSWRSTFRVPGTARVTGMAIDTSQPPTILLATDRGLYASFHGDPHWALVFHGAGAQDAHCTYVAFHLFRAGTALLGTDDGLFLSTDSGRTWTPVMIPRAARPIVHLAFDQRDPDRVHLVTPSALWTGNLTSGQWQHRVTAFHAEESEVEESGALETIETDEETGSLHHLSAIATHPDVPTTLYLSSSRSLRTSTDDGATWQALSRTGLGGATIARIIAQTHSPLAIYAATTRGVARYEPTAQRWTMLASGRAAAAVHDLAIAQHQLWAAAETGLYRFEIPPTAFPDPEPPSPQELLGNFVHEPTIAQVREAAIRYAEVHPDKIKRWRRQAALQALLPNVDLGFTHDASQDLHVDEGSFPNFQLIRTRDRDAGLDLSVTWDLGELIWNDDQTAIDARSKLMVQLRDDLVDEVNRTYFERRRLQVLLLTNPSSNPQTLLEKELRLQELTALLDGLTGGYFSQQLFVGRTR